MLKLMCNGKKGSSINRTKKSLRHSIVLWRDKNLIVTLSFVDSVRKFDLNEIFLEFLLCANAKCKLLTLHKPFKLLENSSLHADSSVSAEKRKGEGSSL